jgi:hypothetical protein
MERQLAGRAAGGTRRKGKAGSADFAIGVVVIGSGLHGTGR